MSPTMHPLRVLREPRDDSERLDESVATTSAHVYNNDPVESSQRCVFAIFPLRLHTSAVGLPAEPATKGM
jgi:hypothetical protein